MIDSVFSTKFSHVYLQSLELSAVEKHVFFILGEMPGIVFGRKSTGQFKVFFLKVKPLYFFKKNIFGEMLGMGIGLSLEGKILNFYFWKLRA